jgi:hypothetical protein
MDTVTLLLNQPYAVDDQLEMTVLFLVEEWDEIRRRADVHITIKMKTSQIEEEISITPENQHFVWRDYDFEYMGGWRKAVLLNIKRTGK